jgi:outer membrane autotransporter protein
MAEPAVRSPDGTLTFNRSNMLFYSGAISGKGAIEQNGSGGAWLSGDSSGFTGTTTINTAGLILSGSLGGTVSIASSVVLVVGFGGTTGSISGNVTNNGLLAFYRSDTLTYGGVISGNGEIQQLGSGSTVLTGDSSGFTGTTSIIGGVLGVAGALGGTFTIDAGAGLLVGNGSTSGSISGNVTNNGLLAFYRSDSLTYGGVLSGNGSVYQVGSGTTVLTGNSSGFTGTTIVQAGTLAVNGTLGGTLLVNAGGRLQGNGTLGDTVVDGTIAPGNSIGTLNIAGTVTFNTGSVFQVEASTAGTADKIIATGAATINGGTVDVRAGSGTWNTSTSYTILQASNVTGTFTSVTSDLAFLTPNLTYGLSDVTLTLARNDIAFAAVAYTPNQRSVGNALDRGPSSGPLPQAVQPLSADQARGAFDQLSGQSHANNIGQMMNGAAYLRNVVLGHMWQAGLGEGEGAAAPNTPPAGVLSYAPQATIQSPIVVKDPVPVSDLPPGFKVWSQGFGSWGTFNGDGNASRFSRDLAGFLTGVDIGSGPWYGGVAGGYSSSHASSGLGGATVESAHLAAYGGWSYGSVKLRAGGAYAFNATSSARTIAFGSFADRATANYGGGTAQVFGEVGYGINLGKLALEPFAGGAWVRVDTDAFSERGGVAALNVAASVFQTGYSTLGLRVASLLTVGNMIILLPRATAAWQHAYGNLTPQTVAAFQNTAANFTTAGVPLARDSLLTEAGLDLALTPNATIGISYIG